MTVGTPGVAPGARDLRRLPKAHLHLHLDGALRPSTLAELTAERGLAPPVLPADGGPTTFAAFTEAITATHGLLADERALPRLVTEVVEDAAADGAVWIEVSVWPGVFGAGADPSGGRWAEGWVELVLDAGRAAGRRLGVGFALMLAANRHEEPAAAVEVARLAGRFAPQGVVSFGLDGDEAAHPPSPFAPAFAVARASGLRCTPHAGELAGPASVAAALDELGADRIGHGVRAVEDPALVERLARAGTCLDVCPTSNVRLGVVPDLAHHPLPALLAAGVPCSINADDPLLFGCSLLGEYERGRHDLGLDDATLADVAATSIRASAAPADVVERARRDIEAWRSSG